MGSIEVSPVKELPGSILPHSFDIMKTKRDPIKKPAIEVRSPFDEPHLKDSSFDLPVAEYPAISSAYTPDDPLEITKIIVEKLASLNAFLESRSFDALASVFASTSYWRDHLGIDPTKFTTLDSIPKIISYLKTAGSVNTLKNVAIEPGRVPTLASIDPAGKIKCLQTFITFETEFGRGKGKVTLLRDLHDNDAWKIYTLFTTLWELKGEEQKWKDGHNRNYHSVPEAWGKDLNWAEYRKLKKEFRKEEPTVLIVGAGHTGLMMAARLQMLGIEALIIDKQERSGDAWRTRYHDLVLHDICWMNAMPYLPYPPNWPILTSKDKMADFFEYYESALELNLWNRSEVVTSTWDKKSKTWRVEVDRVIDGRVERRTLHPRHIIQATGLNGEPQIPIIPGMKSFCGKMSHSTSFTNADASYKGKRVVVIGAGSSGHDLAWTCYKYGAKVTMIQRSPTFVVSIENVHDTVSKRWNEDIPTDDGDINMFSLPMTLFKRIGSDVSRNANIKDRDLLKGLRSAGFQLVDTPLLPSFVALSIQRAGGFYIDVGVSALIATREIGIKYSPEGISHFTASSVVFHNGDETEADEIIFATGFSNGRVRTRKIFGDRVADAIDPIWGFDEEGEIRGAWRRSGHEGFWVAAGGFWLSRYHSRGLALQIKMCEERLTELYD